MKSYSVASQLLSDISTNRELTNAQVADLANLQSLYGILSARSVDSLTVQDLSTLSALARDHKYISAGMAKAILVDYDSLYAPIYHLDGSGITIRSFEGSLEKEQDVLRFFPNPTDGTIFIQGIDVDEMSKHHYQFLLYDVTGQEIQSGILTQPDVEIENRGLFFLTILRDGERIHTEKIIVK